MKSLAQSKYQLIAILNGLLMGIICMTLTNYNSTLLLLLLLLLSFLIAQ